MSKYQILQEKISNQERDLNELKSKVELCATVSPNSEATMKLLQHVEVKAILFKKYMGDGSAKKLNYRGEPKRLNYRGFRKVKLHRVGVAEIVIGLIKNSAQRGQDS